MESALIRRATRVSTPDAIDDNLRALWRELAAGAPVARAVMANLIVIASEEADLKAAVPLDDVVRHHPSRVIVLRHSRTAAGSRPTRAAVSIVSFGPERARYAVEEIALEAPCGDRGLPSVVRRFVRGDLPTAIWWTEDFARLPPIPALTAMARQLVFDSGQWHDVGAAVAALAPLLGSPDAPRLADINWRRLAPLRQALVHAARTLAPSGPLPRVHIAYRPGKAAMAWLVAGWIAARLKWPETAWPVDIEESRRDDEIVKVEAGGLAATMTDGSVVARTPNAPPFRMGVRKETPAAAIAAELSTQSPDPALTDALVALSRQPALKPLSGGPAA